MCRASSVISTVASALLLNILAIVPCTSGKNESQLVFPFHHYTAKHVMKKSNLDLRVQINNKPSLFTDTDFQSLNVENNSFIATRLFSSSSGGHYLSVCASELGITESAYEVGFASLLLMVLDHISFCVLAGGKPIVYWRGGLSFVKKPSFDSWSLLFEPLSINDKDKEKKIICLGRCLFGFDFMRIKSRRNISNLRNLTSRENDAHVNDLKVSFKPKPVVNLKCRRPRVYSSHIDFEGLISSQTKLWVHSLIGKFIKVKKTIRERVERFFHKHLKGSYILGVHARGTDHIDETDFMRLPKLDLWIKETEMIYKSMPSPKKIFVASDNIESLKEFVNHFGRNTVVFTDALRASKYNGPDIRQTSPPLQQLATEVLTDILLLSKCHHFLHGESSVAAVAHYFNPHMKMYFLGELTVGKSSSDVDYVKDDLVYVAEEEDDYPVLMEKYKEYSHTSLCPNMRLRKFLPSSQLGSFFEF